MIALQNYERCFLFHLSISFSSRDIQVFMFPSSPLFLPVSHCFRGWSKKNLKVYEVINCLNKNLITYYIWYLEKEIRCDIETLSIDRVLHTEHFYGKLCAPKASPRPLFNPNITQNSHCMQEILFKIRYFERELSKSLKKVNLIFFSNLVPPMGKIIKNKSGLELVTSRSSGYKTSSKIFLYLLYYRNKFDDVM